MYVLGCMRVCMCVCVCVYKWTIKTPMRKKTNLILFINVHGGLSKGHISSKSKISMTIKFD